VVVSPNPDQTAGEAIDTRRPSVAATQPSSYNGTPAWDTSQGIVFLVLGGGGTNGPSNVYGTDAADGLPQAKVISERNAITGSQAAGFTRNAADSIEDAPGRPPPAPVTPTATPSSTWIPARGRATRPSP
jgi:hypothetical protein